jgi:hypothetical protein
MLFRMNRSVPPLQLSMQWLNPDLNIATSDVSP